MAQDPGNQDQLKNAAQERFGIGGSGGGDSGDANTDEGSTEDTDDSSS